MIDRKASQPWADALLAAKLFAIDASTCGGVLVVAGPGAPRDRWFEALRGMLPADAPCVRVPSHVTDGRLLGGIDIAATVRSGRPITEQGLIDSADGGLIALPMAERMSATMAARLTQAMDAIGHPDKPRFGVIAFDESRDDEMGLTARLEDRLAFKLDLSRLSYRECPVEEARCRERITEARSRLASVEYSDDAVDSICAVSLAMGVAPLRVSTFALTVARLSAAWFGRLQVEQDDLEVAARLVIGPRATLIAPPPEDSPPEPEMPDEADDDDQGESTNPSDETDPVTLMVEAANAAVPEQLLSGLQDQSVRQRSPESIGRQGQSRRSTQRGRPAGVRPGEPGDGGRLNLIETLRAAAPWQRLRSEMVGASKAQIQVRRSDFRMSRYIQRSATTTIFVVDASGSSALNRLAEAKGAVELLLADCYVRRDEVSLIAFRGEEAELLLPATRSLVRAKRALAGLPGGGATPLAAAIQTAAFQAEQIISRGQTPVVVLLTDGRGNIGLDGKPGRAQAREDATTVARYAAELGCSWLLLDTSPRPQAQARELAGELGAEYVPLPFANAAAISAAAKSAQSRSAPTVSGPR